MFVNMYAWDFIPPPYKHKKNNTTKSHSSEKLLFFWKEDFFSKLNFSFSLEITAFKRMLYKDGFLLKLLFFIWSPIKSFSDRNSFYSPPLLHLNMKKNLKFTHPPLVIFKNVFFFILSEMRSSGIFSSQDPSFL